jgi:hypothetical protein
MKNKCVFFALPIILLIGMLFACSSKQPVVGYWQVTSSDNQYHSQYVYFEFTDNGSIIVENPNRIETGKYELTSDIYIKVTADKGEIYSLLRYDTWKFWISGNTLNLRIGDENFTLMRVR